MSRARKLFTTIIPALVAGGLLFGTASGHASAGDGPAELWPYDADAYADPGAADADGDADGARRAPARRTADARRHRTPPMAPMPPAPPVPPAADDGPMPPAPSAPPAPPMPPGARKGGPGRISISVHNGKVQIDGVEIFARHQLDAVREMIRNNPNLPPDVRDRALARLDNARGILERRLKNLSITDLDKLGDELEKMGDELERAMEGLEEEMGRFGDKLGRDLARRLGKDLARSFKPGRIQIDRSDDTDGDRDADGGDDGDDDHAVVVTPDAGLDDEARDAIRDLKDLTLKPAQRDQLAKLRVTSDEEIARARKQLDDASKRLEIALADVKTSDADIARYVDQVSVHEAAIRKARLLAWVNARRLLDDAQRQKIEEAARKNHK